MLGVPVGEREGYDGAAWGMGRYGSGGSMTHVIAAALPVLPGRSDRVRRFADEVAANLDEFARLNREGTFDRYSVFLQESPSGDVAIHVFHVQDPSRIRTAFTDSEYDTWWLDYLRDVHGVDLRSMPEPPPPATLVFDWKQG